ncbi:MAG TPA: PstS family phosphate ABC transporter substrate-binding protein [Nitrospira sp.]|nr:PstS family phosphate ABC transporter substrate-binding protein [Nitrospira sp.]
MQERQSGRKGQHSHSGMGLVAMSLLCFGSMVGTASADTSVATAKPVLDAAIGSYPTTTPVTGRIAIAGSDTMQPIMVKLAAAFQSWQPGIKMVVQGGGSYAGVKGFLIDQATIRRGDAKPSGHLVSGHVALYASSSPMSDEDRKDFKSRYGYDVTELPVAMDAVAIYVNAQNPIQGLSLEQVDAIFGKDRKRGYRTDITKWGDLGLDNGWESHPIHLYGRDKKSGTRAFFLREALADGGMKSEVVEEPGSATEILDISRDPLGMGYAGIGFQATTVRVVPLAPAGSKDYVTPTADTARSGAYPLARYLYLYAKKAPGANVDREVLEFLKFVNSREGQETVARAGFFPLPAAQVAKNLETLSGPSVSALLLSQTR